MIIDDLKKANLVALKEKDKVTRAILSVLINRYSLQEIEKKTKGEEMNDSDTLRIIQKVLKELDEELEGYQKVHNNEEVKNIMKQKDVLSIYLPKLMSEEEILSEISKLDDKSIGSIMKHFKMNFDGRCDMGVVNKLARTFK